MDILHCPKCKAVLTPTQYESGRIYFCNQCSGVWIDGTELYNILGGTPDLPEVIIKEEKECPKCGSISFYPIKYPGTETMIDLCENCNGIWFDPGELRIIKDVMKNETGGEETEEPASVKATSWINNAISTLMDW